MSMDIINCRVQCGTGQQQKTEYEDASSTATSGYHGKHWPICFWINGVQEWIEKKNGNKFIVIFANQMFNHLTIRKLRALYI